jgi:GMP synthase-like glutamine amidotransferase
MRIGLLECDHVRDRYRAIAGDYVDMFTAMVAGADPTAEVVPYDARNGVLPVRPDECDAWLCTGSRASVYDEDPWIEAVAAVIRRVQEAAVPLVGVCFGHQLIAHALGGRTERANVGWGAGALPVHIVVPRPWMDPPLASMTLLHSHQDQVTVLPPGGQVLASAAHCPVAMLSVGDTIIGIQAHPEFGPDYLRALIEDRVDRLTPAGTAAALETLRSPTDEAAVARWITGFLRSRAAGQG